MKIQVDIGEWFPVKLRLLENGSILFLQDAQQLQEPVFDISKDGSMGRFDADAFYLKGPNDTEYNKYVYRIPYPYKDMPVLKSWLVAQELMPPVFEKENYEN